MHALLSYKNIVLGCLVHALILSATISWAVFIANINGMEWYYSTASKIWLLLLIVWPAWGFILWRCSDGKATRIAGPIGLGLVILTPAFFVLLIMFAYAHATHY
jgi:hypothetical protein